jgi:hypothetical protein
MAAPKKATQTRSTHRAMSLKDNDPRTRRDAAVRKRMVALKKLDPVYADIPDLVLGFNALVDGFKAAGLMEE